MDILVVEDNLLVGELIRLAVEDAHFNVVGPIGTLDTGIRVASETKLDGALLDIKLGGTQSFPLARLLQSKSVPFIFVSGYDRSVLPDDIRDARLVAKPVSVADLARVAVESFVEQAKPVAAPEPKSRIEVLLERIASSERRIATQRRRVQKLQFEGHGVEALQGATDILEQMKISVELMKTTLRAIETSPRGLAGSAILRPISDDLIDVDDPRNLETWAAHFGTTVGRLLDLIATAGASAHQVARALDLESMQGPCRKSKALD